MGLGKFKNGKYQPITKFKGSWADSVRKYQNPKSKKLEDCNSCWGLGFSIYTREPCITCGGRGKR